MDITGNINTEDPNDTNKEVKKIYEKLFGSALFGEVELVLEDITKFSVELWDKYYASQYIPSRKNFKLFVNRLPRKYLKWSGLSTEARFGNRCLDEFVNKD